MCFYKMLLAKAHVDCCVETKASPCNDNVERHRKRPWAVWWPINPHL